VVETGAKATLKQIQGLKSEGVLPKKGFKESSEASSRERERISQQGRRRGKTS